MSILKSEEVIDYALRLSRESGFTLRDTQFRTWRSWLFQETEPKTGIDTKVQYRPYDLADDAHAFKNRMLAAPVKVQIAATGSSERAGNRAQEQENFCRRHYYHWRDQGVFDPVLFDMASLGIGWTRLFLNPDALPLFADYDGQNEDKYLEEAEKQIKQFVREQSADLFMLEHVDAETMYYAPDKRVVVQAARVPFYRLQKDYAAKGKRIEKDGAGYAVRTLGEGEPTDNSISNAWTDYATVYTLEDDEYCYHVLQDGTQDSPDQPGGHLLGVYRNYFGRPSFSYTYAERTGSKEPKKEFAPLLGGKYTIIPLLAQQVTALVNAGLDAAQMRFALEPRDGAVPALEGAVTIDTTEDGTLIIPDGYQLKVPDTTLGVDVEKTIGLLRDLDHFGMPRILKNPEEVQATAGYDRALQQDTVQSLLGPPLSHYGTMLATVFMMQGHAVKELGEEVSCQNLYRPDGKRMVGETITLKPSSVIDADISVDFNSVTLYNRIAMIETDRILMQADLQTETRMLSDTLSIDDPEEFRMERDMDKVRKAAGDRAVADVLLAIDAMRGGVMDEAMAETATEPIVPTNEDALRSDRGPSYPTGPGMGQALTPTPPQNGMVVP